MITTLDLIVQIGIIFGLLFMTGLSAFILFKRCKNSSPFREATKREEEEEGNVHYIEKEALIKTEKLDPSALTVYEESKLGKGIFKATYKNRTVAAKVFPKSKVTAFLTEKSVYELAHLNNGSSTALMEYFGTAEHSLDQILVMEMAEIGSLRSHIIQNTLSWNQLRKILVSVSQALSNLHADNLIDKNVKVNVCHRNLNCSNILMKSDLTCRIADFSSARIFVTNVDTGQRVKSHHQVVKELGQVRYLSPELLEGSIDLTDCENALKQCDIYALGLIFWEIGSRCKDLYQGADVPRYAKAFQAEIGPDDPVDRDQMKILVSKNKARPLFPQVWKDSNPAIKLLKETIEYCWDGDGEARLTAMCIVERMRELEQLWERYKMYCKNNQANLLEKTTLFNSVFHRNNILPPSEGLTEENPVKVRGKKNEVNVLSRQSPKIQLQPHQGRNPCEERNKNPSASSDENRALIRSSAKDEERYHRRRNISVDEMDFQEIVASQRRELERRLIPQQQQQQQQQSNRRIQILINDLELRPKNSNLDRV